MNVDAWNVGDEDIGRAKRLAVGYATGVVIIALVAGVAATVRGAELPKDEDVIVDVKLASAPTVAPAPPPPPPPPPALEAPKVVAPGPAPRKAIVAPTAIPTEAPAESDKPSKAKTGPDEYADGKGGVINGAPGGTGTGTVAPQAPPPPPSAAPPPAPPKPAGPIALTEDMTPPVPVSTPQPAYPADARSEGVQATVVVRFVITESGDVTQVTIVRGHPLFDAAVLATVRTWRYRPALSDGRPVQVTKTVPVRFSIKM